MKTKLFLFLSLLLLISCNTQKRVTENVTQKQQTEAEVKKESTVNESLTTAQNTAVKTDSSGVKTSTIQEVNNQEMETKTTVFDTSKPVDPKTGRPPVASESTTTTKSVSTKNAATNEKSGLKKSEDASSETDWNKKIKEAVDSAMKANEKVIANTEIVETQTGWPWWLWVLIGAGVTILSYFAIKYKWWKKLSFLLPV